MAARVARSPVTARRDVLQIDVVRDLDGRVLTAIRRERAVRVGLGAAGAAHPTSAVPGSLAGTR